MFYLRSGKLKIGQEFWVFDFQFYYTNSPWRVNRKVHCSQSPIFSKIVEIEFKALRYAGGHLGFKCTAEKDSWVSSGGGRKVCKISSKKPKNSLSVWEETFFIFAFVFLWFSVLVSLHKSNFVIRIYSKKKCFGHMESWMYLWNLKRNRETLL